jgi:hypothetical protein
MANPEHLKILREGVSRWNKWRGQHPQTQPDLGGAELAFADLHGAALLKANLVEAYLFKVNLNEADLSGANLSGAKLIKADLTYAKFRGADLRCADLSGANLRWAELAGTRLDEADLSGANLSRASLLYATLARTNIGKTNFSKADFGQGILVDVDLNKALGLESVKHFFPSSIGIDTFLKSKGKIPEVFLRGAGVPDIFIEYAASLAGKAIEFYSAFISYSSKDEDLAKRLYADLQTKGVRCWFAPEDLKIGDKFRTEIDRAIRVHDKLLLLLSANSILSDWVEKEVETAFDRERHDKRTVLFPIRLDDTIVDAVDGWAADIRRTRHIGDFTNWKDHDSYQTAFERLLRDLKASTK